MYTLLDGTQLNAVSGYNPTAVNNANTKITELEDLLSFAKWIGETDLSKAEVPIQL